VKKVDYYASQQPWKMPKWLGATIGGIFAFIAVGCAFVIMHLTKTDAPAAVAAAAPAVAKEPVADEAPAVAAPAAPAAKVAVATKEPRESRKHGKHSSSKASKKHGHATTLAKHSPAISSGKASAILAKRDNKSNRKDKDALDKLLGL